MAGGGGADTGDAEASTEKNIEFQKDIANQTLALAAPYNQVGYQALGNLASLSGVDAPTLQPNYAGTLDDPRFVPQANGTAADRIAALGPAPEQYLTQQGEQQPLNYYPWQYSPTPGNEGRNSVTPTAAQVQQMIDNSRATSTSQTVNPAWQSYQDQVAAINSQGDLPGPLSTEERRNKVLSDFYASPEYNITFGEALKQSDKAIAQSAAARGQLNSAPTFNARGENAASLGNQTFSQFRGNLAQLAGFGTTGLATSTNGLNNAGAQVGSAYSNLANIQGNAAIQEANSRSSGFGSALGAFGSILGGF